MFDRMGGTSGVSEVHAVPLFLIIVGVFVFLLGMMGFFGAACLNPCMLKTVVPQIILYHFLSSIQSFLQL